MKVLVDMNLSPRWVGVLTAAGIDAAHWSTVGPRNAADREIMAHALTHDFIVLTQDLDFSAILAATQGKKPSVVQLRADDTNPDVIGRAVLDALTQMNTDLQDGALLTIEPGRARLRVLPLRRS
jgi:predicted nuclease of predicted toxin-antitoxin system